jgi:hypothetical protein
MLGFPLPTVSLTKQIYTALERIWDGRNSVYTAEFTSPTDKEDWLEYRESVVGSYDRWRTEGFEAMKSRINSVLVCDLPEEQKGDNPEPYFYWLDIDRIYDFELKGVSDIEWIMWYENSDTLVVIDDESYRKFTVLKANEIKTEPLLENPHGIGYTPARFFWTTPVDYRQPIIKQSPLTPQLDKLDKLLMYSVGNENLNMYGRWPITSMFKVDCNYRDDEAEHLCQGGILRTYDGLWVKNGDGNVGCPLCSNKRFGGPGSILAVDPPNANNDKVDLRNPVTITPADVQSLEYNNKDLLQRGEAIYSAVTGWQGSPLNDQAINLEHVRAIFETLESALSQPQNNFEQAISWVDETLCRLRYDTVVSISVDLGTEHYILGAEVVLGMYYLAMEKKSGSQVLDIIQDLYFETTYRNNPEMLQRQKMLTQIDPLRHVTSEAARTMYGANELNYETYILKINLSTLLGRFERENVPITEFGQSLSLAVRIDKIVESLKVYAAEMKPEEIKPPEAPTPPTES